MVESAPAAVPAVVHIDESMLNHEIIEDYYSFCKIEPIGPYQAMRVNQISFFRNLVDLSERLLSSAPIFTYHIIVAHGNPDRGLLIDFSKASKSSATGLIVGELIALVKKIEAGTHTKPSNWFRDPDLAQLMSKLGTTDNVDALRIAENLTKIRKRRLVISVRGCNIGKSIILMNSYKEALGAVRFMAPESRNLFVRIHPQPDAPGTRTTGQQLQRMSLERHPRYPRDPAVARLGGRRIRRRFFAGETNARLQPIVIDVIDIDGHENVAARAYMLELSESVAWARTLNGDWTRQSDRNFVLQVMWEDTEDSWHYPKELSFTGKIRVA